MMELSRRVLLFLTFTLSLVCGFQNDGPGSHGFQTSENEVLENVKSFLWDPRGRQFTIRWYYTVGEDVWKGDGMLQILGRDYLRFTLPEQEILIKGSVVMSWFRETDQVIIDDFDRRDPGNVFSVLLGELNEFSVLESRSDSDSTLLLKLRNETLIGFEELDISVDKREWTPVLIRAKAGEDMSVVIEIVDSETLPRPDDLINASLNGSEMIDLRE